MMLYVDKCHKWSQWPLEGVRTRRDFSSVATQLDMGIMSQRVEEAPIGLNQSLELVHGNTVNETSLSRTSMTFNMLWT